MLIPANIELWPMTRGADYESQWLEIKVNDVVKNLTGCTVAMHIYHDGALYATLTDGAGLVMGYTTGRVQMTRTPAFTSVYPKGLCSYRLFITEIDGTINNYAQGILPVG
jgi:hypothetical protein